MLNRSPSLSVTILPSMQLLNSSTSCPEFAAFTRARKTLLRRCKIGVSPEVCLSPTGCRTRSDCRTVSRPVDGFGERNESVEKQRSAFAKPNRKERFNSALGALLITPNTSGIALFEDQQRHQSAAVFGLVMDRSAKCTAGGYDVV